ncbi:hypothetical protein CPT_MarsHill_053 [Staphylococcus phage MarsHill]|nr:hypothetical protein CPT_MarsHill_053 [Staphylococcus phage MarsHill]QQO92709.1 hypothetical protein CPT_Madawaska_052 [Staphylococcus phage Madawaska]
MVETIEQVTIKNEDLQTVYDVLYNIPLNGNKSRHRTKFINQLKEFYEEYAKDRQDMINEFSKKDENGNIVKDPKDPESIVLNVSEFPNAKEDILAIDEEKAVITVRDKSILLNIIDNMETQLSGKKATIIDTLAEQLEDY